jgi:excinuclease ABC subunit A
MPKPDVDKIDGLSPAIAIEQKTVSKNPRSTVGTITEIYDYLRLLFARIGVPYSPKTGLPIKAQTISQIVDSIFSFAEQTKLYILAPIVRQRKGEHNAELANIKRKGFERVFIDGDIYQIDETPTIAKNTKHIISTVIDRISIASDDNDLRQRVANSVEIALKQSDGIVIARNYETGEETIYSEHFSCPVSGFCIPEIEPRLFSFNSAKGACPKCGGIGYSQFGEGHSFSNMPVDDDELGISDLIDMFLTRNPICPECKGTRLSKEALAVKIDSKNIAEVSDLTVDEGLVWLENLWEKLTGKEKSISEKIIQEIKGRLGFLKNVGLDYLTISRPSGTLSGGEGQRIKLASQIGSGLTGIMYVLDEPSIGLHQRDNVKLIDTLKALRDHENSVIVVEHDEETILASDWVVDIGPRAGIHGGEVIAEGTVEDIKKNPKSLTGQYMSGALSIPVPRYRKKANLHRYIEVTNANVNNLKNINVKFPVGAMTCVTGVSGSGKSTLVINTLFEGVYKAMSARKKTAAENIKGLEFIDKVVDISQAPIGRTPRSNPATYVGCFTDIRNLFATMPEARARGYQSSRFSFNVKGGRCEACKGDGVLKVEMHFLPDVYVECDQCRGKRFSEETLSIKFKGKDIADVLDMTIEDGTKLFESHPQIHSKLSCLCRVGLGYLTIGHKATILSGGEAQRVKLAKELSRKSTGNTLYILDEPTTGLHMDDIKKLLEILQVLVDHGNTIVIIEHNMDVIKTADWLIDIGPESGNKGGQVVVEGTPETVALCEASYTGRYLKSYLRLSD